MSTVVRHTPKLWGRKNGEGEYFVVWCPGCKCGHGIPTPRWNFDGKYEQPTFSPSVRLYVTDPETKKESTICHFNVTAGKLQLHADCQHELKGQTVDMIAIPENYGFD